MNVLEASIEILKIVTSGQSIEGVDIDSKTERVLESFHKIYQTIDLTVNPDKKYDLGSDTLEIINPSLTGSRDVEILDSTLKSSRDVELIDKTLKSSRDVELIDKTLKSSRDVEEVIDPSLRGG